MKNERVTQTLNTCKVSLEELGHLRGVTKQRISAKLKTELTDQEQESYIRDIISIAKERIDEAEHIAGA